MRTYIFIYKYAGYIIIVCVLFLLISNCNQQFEKAFYVIKFNSNYKHLYVCVYSPFDNEPNWLPSIKNLQNDVGELLQVMNVSVSFNTITQCSSNVIRYTSAQSVRKHAREVLGVLEWKTRNKAQIQKQIREYIFDHWRDDIYKYFAFVPPLTTMNTQALQTIAGCSDHKWRDMVKCLHEHLEKKLFASERNIQTLRPMMRPMSRKTFSMRLQRESSNQFKPVNNDKFWISSIGDNEIIAQCLDNFVNRNEWIWELSKFGHTIWNQIGMDKATKGGYNESIALVAGKFSVKNSMCSIHVPGMYIRLFNSN